MLPYDRRLTERSRQLRNKMTSAEQFLWSKLKEKQLGCWFYRQKPIGIYIADFYCHKAKLVIEVDGAQHLSSENAEYDKERNEYMASIGIKVLRFSNKQVLTSIEGVTKRIQKEIE
jgi:very-short-patch-repair endonuclease